jgi:TldD protein
MPKASFSAYLETSRDGIVGLAERLGKCFDYASVLGADSRGIFARSAPTLSEYRESDWGERGFVARVQRDGKVVEWSFDELGDPAERAEDLASRLEALLAAGGESIAYPPIPDEPMAMSWRSELDRDPLAEDPAALLAVLAAARERMASRGPLIVFSQALCEFLSVSKIFASRGRIMDQALTWGNAYALCMARRGEESRRGGLPCSGLAGLEILDGLPAMADYAASEALDLLDAIRPEPGEWDVILSPNVSGLIAHEAFGHGVETDMFAKGRARAAEYLGKPVASPLVTMHEGALGVSQTGSYGFDDEGTPATKTTVIERGVLKGGISDALSALTLGMPRTGNGRRQNFGHKAYARMTNTYFAPGRDSLEAMIASIEKGYLLDDFDSGMEDPKNWGIQGVLQIGREIRDGKLTGRIASPVVISGYVPDVLMAVSMVSPDFELAGSGYCGKGHKEFVKTSTGGPYIKTRMRVG